MTRRQDIVDAAARVLESEGPEALTMRRLADEMGIRAPSLYKHVSGKEQVEAALQERALRALADRMRTAGPGFSGFASTYRAWAMENPRLYELATRRPLDRSELEAGVEDAAAQGLLSLAGGDRAVARAAWGTAHGLVDLELAGRFPPGADVDAAWAAAVSAFETFVSRDGRG